MQSMVNDIHAPQDNLSAEEWAQAEQIMRELDDAMNAPVNEEKSPPPGGLGLGITRGPCKARGEHVFANGYAIAVCQPDYRSLPQTDDIDLMHANAIFIAEAFNVHHETGMGPRQMAAQLDWYKATLNDLNDENNKLHPEISKVRQERDRLAAERAELREALEKTHVMLCNARQLVSGWKTTTPSNEWTEGDEQVSLEMATVHQTIDAILARTRGRREGGGLTS